MRAYKVRLSIAQNVKAFIELAQACPFDVDVQQGRWLVDGKSPGVFSLNLSRPVTVIFYGEPSYELERRLSALRLD